MGSTGDSGAKRLGRPRDTDSADTRRRILDIARRAFANVGYGAATNRDLAARVGITAGTLYHYFGSKLDLYLAVNEDVQQLVYARFNAAVDAAEGFLGKFDAVLETASELNHHDPTLAAFLGSSRVDMRRHPEIAEALGSHALRRESFFVGLVDEGVRTGEIAVQHRAMAIEFIATILIGLTDGVSEDGARHRRAVDSIKKVVRGELLTPGCCRHVGGACTVGPTTDGGVSWGCWMAVSRASRAERGASVSASRRDSSTRAPRWC